MGGYDPYSSSKGCAELVTAAYRRSFDLPLASARAGNVIGGGDWSFGWGAQEDGDSITAIREALDLGVNWIDTAAVYGLGHSEEVVARALEGQFDVCIIDTAGRLQTQANLMQELAKIRRVIAKQIPDAPHETLLVIDATAGQNALSQAKGFKEAAGCTGIVLSKLDGSARGGVIVPVVEQFGLPVKFVGLGESADDLEPFDPERFVAALLEGALAA
jgi:hypothetical protein